MIATELLDEVLEEFLRPVRKPPRPRGMLEFARSCWIPVSDEDTGQDIWVQFDPTLHKAQYEVLRAFAAGGFLELVVLGPVQDGKTLVSIVIPMLYCLVELRQNAMLMLPAANEAINVWIEKFLPIIHHSGLGWILPSDRGTGAGGRGATSSHMLLNTGARVYLVGAGGENESAQANFTCRFGFLDEASKVRPRFIDLAQQRQGSYDQHGRFMRTSTLRNPQDRGADKDLTLVGYRDSTGGRLHFQCPLCVAERHPSGGWQSWHHSRVTFDRSDDEIALSSVRMGCAYVPEHKLTNEQHKASLRGAYRLVYRGQTVQPDGTVTGEKPKSSSAGILWTCWDSPLKSLGKLAITWRKAEHQLAASGDHAKLEILWHESFVEPYEGKRAGRPGEISNAALASISLTSKVLKRIVPSWARYIVLSQDPGKRQHYWLLTAFGTEEQTAIVDYGYESTVPHGIAREDYEPTPADHRRVFDAIDDMGRRGWQVEGRPLEAPRLQPALCGLDVGYIQNQLLPHITGTRWIPIKGVGKRDERGKPITVSGSDLAIPQALTGLMRITRPDNWFVDCWWAVGDLIRHRVHAGLLRQPGPGACLIPRGLKPNDQLLLHLSAVLWTQDEKSQRWYWREKVHPRWDLLDLAIYNWMLGRYYHEHLEMASRRSQQQAERPIVPMSQHREHTIQRRTYITPRRRSADDD